MGATLLSYRTRVRQRADMEKTDFIGDDELDHFINQSAAELYDLLVSKFEDYYAADPFEFSLGGADNSYPLPSDFYKLRGVDRSLGGGQYADVQRFNFKDRNRRANSLYRSYGQVKYRIVGNKIQFTPYDQCSGNYRVHYIPKPIVGLVGDPGNGIAQVDLNDFMDYDEFIVIDAAIKCLVKEESDTSALQLAKDNITRRIMALSAGLDSSNPDVIADVTGASDDDWVNPIW